MTKLIIQKNKGFTLVEALVSISILVMAVTGAFTAAQSGISSSNFSKNQIIAFYLAGEGVEQIRNKRDENGLYNGANPESQINWLTGIASDNSDPCFTGKKCKVDAVAGTITTCDSGICPNLELDPVAGFYGYTNPNKTYASSTIFNREIYMNKIPNTDDDWSITVIVDWSNKGLVRRFVIKENIMNWQ